MSKTFIANPTTGLQGVPPRITLDESGLTIKTGVIAKSKSYSYKDISSVTIDGLTSFASKLTIVPNMEPKIELLGFSRAQAKVIQKAVRDGYFQDETETSSFSEEDVESNVEDFVESRQTSSTELTPSPAANLSNQLVDDVINADVDPTDEKALVKHLTSLISRVESVALDSDISSKDSERIKKAAMSKYETELQMLMMTFPDNKMIPFFSAKIEELKGKEKTQKEEEKKETKKAWRTLLFIVIGGFLFLAILAGLM